MGAGEEARSWAAAHKKLMAVIATATAIVGLATGVLTLQDRLFPKQQPEPEPAAGVKVAAAQEGGLTAATVSRLSDDVQVTRFEQLLGAPMSRTRLQNDEWLVSTWESPDMAVSAFSDRDSQVVAYTVTSLGPGFTPLVEHVRGGVRLRDSVFAEILDEPLGVAGVFPPNGRFSYEEAYFGGGATQGRSVVLAASFAANADDRVVTELGLLGDCLPFSVFERSQGCPPDRLETLRAGLRVTSMTVGEAAALEALANDGAVFHPDAGAS